MGSQALIAAIATALSARQPTERELSHAKLSGATRRQTLVRAAPLNSRSVSHHRNGHD